VTDQENRTTHQSTNVEYDKEMENIVIGTENSKSMDADKMETHEVIKQINASQWLWRNNVRSHSERSQEKAVMIFSEKVLTQS
jgi:hypothetical protein